MFADAAHFVHGKCEAYLWSDGPRYKSTGSGRYRLNVYGAFDPVSNRLLSQYSSDNINADYVVGFLRWLRSRHYPDQSRRLNFCIGQRALSALRMGAPDGRIAQHNLGISATLLTQSQPD